MGEGGRGGEVGRGKTSATRALPWRIPGGTASRQPPQHLPSLRHIPPIPCRSPRREAFQRLPSLRGAAELGGFEPEVPEGIPEAGIVVHRLLPGVDGLLLVAELPEGYPEVVPGARELALPLDRPARPVAGLRPVPETQLDEAELLAGVGI